MSLLRAETIAYPGRFAPTDLAVDAGERVAVIGPNGAGKTSLLRALAQAQGTTGRVTIAGRMLGPAPPAQRRRLLGYVPAARDAVWPIRVRDAVADGGATPAQVKRWLLALELDGLAARAVSGVSTGERARVFLARALAPSPPVVLADEPVANLDPRWRLRVAELLGDAAAEGAAVLASVHDLDLALVWASRVLVVEGGTLVADATPDHLERSGVIDHVFGVRRTPNGWAAL